MSFSQIWNLYFGYPGGAVYSNLIASVICVGVAWVQLHRQSAKQHVQMLAQAAKQHKEKLEQSDAQHKAQMDLLRKNHSQLSDQVAAAPVQTMVTDENGRPVQPDGAVIAESPAAAKRREARVQGGKP